MNPTAITLLLAAALAGFGALAWRKLAIVMRLAPEVRWDHPLARFRAVLVNGFLQSRMVAREWKPGLMHAVIFLGFMTLLLRKVQLLVIGYDETFVYSGLAGGMFASLKDVVELALSFDGAKTWIAVGKVVGPTQGRSEYFKFTDVPTEAKKALLRFDMNGRNTVGVLSLRADADYKDPQAAASFRPFNVIHRWKDRGDKKSHSERVTKLPYEYKIKSAGEPEMVSVSYEMPARNRP